MANEVYTQALGGVQSLVSARAARRALEGALRAKGETPDTVSAEVMSRILLGPVLSEFETILPRDGLKRQLRSLAASLRKNFPKDAADAPSEVPKPSVDAEDGAVDNAKILVEVSAEAPAANTSPVEPVADPGFVYQTNALSEVPESLDLIFSVSSSAVRSPRVPQAEAERAQKPERDTASPVSAVLETPDLLEIPEELLSHSPEFVAAPEPAPMSASAPPLVPLSQEQLGDAVLRFAQLEGVKFVAALRPNGEVAAQRGSGIDVDALAQLGLVGLKLLRRSGPLRTFYLAHTGGQLFLLPFGMDTLALVGTPELNIGAVFNTLATLKEEK